MGVRGNEIGPAPRKRPRPEPQEDSPVIARESSVFLVLCLVACSGRPFGEPIFDTGGAGGVSGAGNGAGTGGAAGELSGGSGGASGGSGEDAGTLDAAPDAAPDAGPCGPLMIQSGLVCVDKQPALHADGSQGIAVSFAEAVAICEARGARLCAKEEREATCPGPSNFCAGPANTWEWSKASACSSGRCVSPCCNSAQACQCDAPETQAQSFRCCRDL